MQRGRSILVNNKFFFISMLSIDFHGSPFVEFMDSGSDRFVLVSCLRFPHMI